MPDLKPGHSMVLAADVQTLTDEQRQTVIAWFAENPDGGYKAALANVGIRATKAEARALLHADDEIRDARLQGMKLDEGSLFRRLGVIANSEDHKDQFRAVTWGLNALHRYHENSTVEHTGTTGLEVTVEHDYGRLLDKLEHVGLLRRGPATAPPAQDLPVLPARTD